MVPAGNKAKRLSSVNHITKTIHHHHHHHHHHNIRKICTGQVDDYTTGCFLDYTYFKKYYKIIAIDLSKQQALDADRKAIQQINFTANLNRVGNIRFYFILEQAKETVSEFSQGTVKVL